MRNPEKCKKHKVNLPDLKAVDSFHLKCEEIDTPVEEDYEEEDKADLYDLLLKELKKSDGAN